MSKHKIYRAGMILYHLDEATDSIYMLFMRPSNPEYGSFFFFQCLKGKIEEGETALEAALREAQEEGGLFIPNIDGEPHKLGVFLGRTTIFVSKIKDPNMFGEHDSETESTKWMSPEEFNESGRSLHRPIVKAAVRWIKETEKLE